MPTEVAKIDSNLEEVQASGYFTQYYCEFGNLETGERLFSSGEPLVYFDLASLTKPLVTGALCWELISIDPSLRNAKLGSFLRKLPIRQEILDIKIERLLSHQSILPAWQNYWCNRLSPARIDYRRSAEEHVSDRLRFLPLKEPLERTYSRYSDIGYILLGYALESIRRSPLENQFTGLCERLGDNLPERLIFNLSEINCNQRMVVASTGYCHNRQRLLSGEVHDENAAALGGVAGHAGLFGQGAAVGAFLRNLYNDSCYREYLMQSDSAEGGATLPMGLKRLRYRGLLKNKFLGHDGFTGTLFWVDMNSNNYGVFLTNRVISGRCSRQIIDLRVSLVNRLGELFG